MLVYIESNILTCLWVVSRDFSTLIAHLSPVDLSNHPFVGQQRAMRMWRNHENIIEWRVGFLPVEGRACFSPKQKRSKCHRRSDKPWLRTVDHDSLKVQHQNQRYSTEIGSCGRSENDVQRTLDEYPLRSDESHSRYSPVIVLLTSSVRPRRKWCKMLVFIHPNCQWILREASNIEKNIKKCSN